MKNPKVQPSGGVKPVKLTPFPKQFKQFKGIIRGVLEQIFALTPKFYSLHHLNAESVFGRETNGRFFIELKYQDRTSGVPHREYYLILNLTFEMGNPDCSNVLLPGLGWNLFLAGKGNDDLEAKIRDILNQAGA